MTKQFINKFDVLIQGLEEYSTSQATHSPRDVLGAQASFKELKAAMWEQGLIGKKVGDVPMGLARNRGISRVWASMDCLACISDLV